MSIRSISNISEIYVSNSGSKDTNKSSSIKQIFDFFKERKNSESILNSFDSITSSSSEDHLSEEENTITINNVLKELEIENL